MAICVSEQMPDRDQGFMLKSSVNIQMQKRDQHHEIKTPKSVSFSPKMCKYVLVCTSTKKQTTKCKIISGDFFPEESTCHTKLGTNSNVGYLQR